MRATPTGADAAGELDLREMWNVLRRRRWLVAGCGLLGVAAGWAFARTRTPVYEAYALVRIDEQRAGLPRLDPQRVLPSGNQIGTEIGVLRSRELAQAVVDSLRLTVKVSSSVPVERAELFSQVAPAVEDGRAAYRFDRQPDGRFLVQRVDSSAPPDTFAVGQQIALDGATLVLAPTSGRYASLDVAVRPRRPAVDEVMGGLDVKQPSRDADIIRVAFRSADPALARDVVNATTARFLELRRSAQTADLRSTTQYLRQQIDTVAAQLAVAEDELRSFREREQVIDPEVEGGTQVRRLAELQAQRTSIEAERVALTELLAQVSAAAATQRPGDLSPYRRLVAFPTLGRQGAAGDILSSLTRVEQERTELLVRRRPEDPDVEALSARIRELEEQLGTIVRTYMKGLSVQVASIDAALAQYERQLSRLPANEVQFARLSRQPKVLAELYALLQTRLKEAEVAAAAEDPTVRVIDAATLPTRPVPSRGGLIIAGLGLLGLALGLGLGVVREYADQSVRTRSDAEAAVGVPVLGLIPSHAAALALERPGGARRLLPARSGERREGERVGSAVLADAYGRLHLNIRSARQTSRVKTLLITSALPGDGKTFNAGNLAVTLAQRGLRVLLIDADLRRGTLHEAFQEPLSPGLSEVLTKQITPAEALRPVRVGGGQMLHVLTAGQAPADPAGLLGSSIMRDLLALAAPQYDYVIIDSSPINVVGDAALVASWVDGVLVVARTGRTPYPALAYASEQLQAANVPILGVVLNDIDFRQAGTYDVAFDSYSYGAPYYMAGRDG
jgi:polysaccharide biosynthesis transport protein